MAPLDEDTSNQVFDTLSEWEDILKNLPDLPEMEP